MQTEREISKYEDLRNSTWQYLLTNGLSVRKLAKNMQLPYYSLYRFLQGRTCKYPRKNTLDALTNLLHAKDIVFEDAVKPANIEKQMDTMYVNNRYDSDLMLKIFHVISEIIKSEGIRFKNYKHAWDLVESIHDFHSQTGRKRDIDRDFIRFILSRNNF